MPNQAIGNDGPPEPGIFKRIPGFPGCWAGTDGSIWSYLPRGPKRKTLSWRKVKPSKQGPYLCVDLYRTWGRRHNICAVHRVILETFIGPCPNGMEGCHRNGRHHDNRLANLRWDTHKRNGDGMAKHGRAARSALRGSENPSSKLTEADVIAIRRLVQRGVALKSLLQWFPINRTTMHSIVCGNTWKHVTVQLPARSKIA